MLKCTSIKYYGNKVNVMQIEFGNICPETRGKISHSFFFWWVSVAKARSPNFAGFFFMACTRQQ